MLKTFIKEHRVIFKILAVVVGGTIGFLYYKFIGCVNGTCPITSNPVLSIIWGAVLGFVISA